MDHARIDASVGGPETGWVTVAKAAAALTDSNDPIDASNVSRYLARFPDIPQRREGKFRFVDLASLKQHRRSNVLVGEKQASREIAPASAGAVPSRRPAAEVPEDEDGDGDLRPGSAVQRANLRLRLLQIRERELDIAEREGALIPDHEVLVLVSGTMETFIAALEREEIGITTTFGREVGAAVRKARKAAQAAASARLIEMAQKSMPDPVVGRLAEAPTDREAAA